MTATINDGHHPEAVEAAADDRQTTETKITTIIFDVDDTLYDVGTVSLYVLYGELWFYIYQLSNPLWFSTSYFLMSWCLVCTLHISIIDSLIVHPQGFTAHRNTEGATSFMVDKLYFPSKAEAQIVRDEYFKRYHSTAKVRMWCIMSFSRHVRIAIASTLMMSYADFIFVSGADSSRSWG